ncbi:MAG: 1-acyl-sn-glycerol-3-phosphate acyltransferase [Bacteroidales bacterium]|nr:1-acyl-sn-glycerol-3-phosphate acyltransferase [Bacteroidales bacterium]
MIIKARHHKVIYPFFKWYTLYIVRKNFSSVIVNGHYIEKNLPVLLLSNHSTWWDGFWSLWLNQKVFKRKFHFMMLENQLRKHWYFNYAGGFSVKKQSRSVMETMGYTAQLLRNKNNLVLLFPQGKLVSVHQQEIRFGRGTEKVLEMAQKPVNIVFLVCLTEYFSDKKPRLYLYFTDFDMGTSGLHNLEAHYNSFYVKCIEKQAAIEE